MKYLSLNRPTFTKVIALAHNLKSYDGQFILKYMIEKLKWAPEVIMSGSKIQIISYKNIKVIDSLNFLSTKLSSLPQMFGLKCDSKGHFPHYFNTKENRGYIGKIPPPSAYGSNEMKPEDRVEFLKWHNEETSKNVRFNFREELDRYCKQGVNILRLACLKFRNIFIEENQIDPFYRCITIASACMLTYRKHFLKKDSIGIIPNRGYRLSDTQSMVALQWLRREEMQRAVHIQHSGNGREKRLCGCKVIYV